MRPLALSLILALFAPLTTPAFAQDTPRSKPTSSQKARFEGAYLTKRFAERFQGSLEKALGRTFDSPVEFVITDTLGMSALIKQESEALSEALTDVDPAEFSKQSQALAKAVLAKIRLADGKILINPATFKLFSKLYDPGCWSESFLDAVLIHEAVHAAQHQAHSLGTFLRGQTKLPALRARMCVVEGHAQLVARQATKDLGLEEGFKLLLAVASELPKQVPPEHRELMKVLVAEAAIPYVAGEAFMKALAKAEGSTLKAEARAFKSPPTTIRQVTRPGEYLDPPPKNSELAPLVLEMSKRLGIPELTRQQIASISDPQLRAALALADAKLLDRCLKDLSQVVVMVAGSPAGKQAIMVVSRFGSTQGAKDLLTIERQVLAQKDKDFSRPDSPYKLTSLEYGPSPFKTTQGFTSTRTALAHGSEVKVFTVVIQWDNYCVEAFLTNVEGAPEKLISFLERALPVLGAKPARSKGAEKPKASKSESKSGEPKTE